MPVTVGNYTAVPGSPAAGDRHICDDSPYTRIYDGAAWQDWLHGYKVASAPTNGTWNAAGGGAVTSQGGGIYNNAGTGLVFCYTAKPVGATWTAQFALSKYAREGRSEFGVYDTGSGKAVTLFTNQGSNEWYIARYTTLGAVPVYTSISSPAGDRTAGPYLYCELEYASATVLNFKVGGGAGFYSMATLHTENPSSHMGGTITSTCFGTTDYCWHYEGA